MLSTKKEKLEDWRQIIAVFSTVCLLVIFSGCDSNDPDEDIVITPTSVAGQWEGIVVSDSTEFPVSMEIFEEQTILTGTGTVVLDTLTLTFNIDPSSSYIHPLVNMFLFFERPPLGTLNGVVSTDRQEINGTMSGPGFSGPAEFTMSRM